MLKPSEYQYLLRNEFVEIRIQHQGNGCMLEIYSVVERSRWNHFLGGIDANNIVAGFRKAFAIEAIEQKLNKIQEVLDGMSNVQK